MKPSKQKTVPTPSVTNPPARRKSKSRLWLIVGLIVALGGVGTPTLFFLRRQAFAMRARASMPTRPDLSGRPVQLADAVASAEAMARSAGSAREGVAELGRLYHANAFNAEAEACWQFLHAEQPREARWCYYLADLRRSAGDYPAMRSLIEDTLRLAPDYVPARLQLANLQFKTGEFDLAERNYRQRLAQLPQDPYARLGLARLALQHVQKDEARSMLETLLKDSPAFGTAHNLLAEILEGEGDAAGAERQRWLGDQATRFHEAEDPWLDELHGWCFDYSRLCMIGMVEYQSNHLDDAEAFYQRAAGLEPEEPQAYELLGALYITTNAPGKARDMLERGLTRLRGKKPSALYFTNLSRAYLMLNQRAEAVEAARRGLALIGESVELLDALGLALANTGQHEQAIKAWHAALAHSPNAAKANFNLATSLLALHRTDEALEALDRSLVMEPTFPETLRLRAQLEISADHWDLAEKYLRPLYEAHPEMPNVRYMYGYWLLHAGTEAGSNHDAAAAERYFREGLTVDPSSADLQLSLGVLLVATRRFDEALPLLESYHRLQPEYAQGCAMLGQAYIGVGRTTDARKVLMEGEELARRTDDAANGDLCRELLQRL